MKWRATVGKGGAALGIGAVGGLLFDLLGLPLAWMLGSMVATFLASLARAPIALPDRLRPPMVTVVGTMLGASLTIEMLALAATWWLPLLGLLGLVAGGAILCILYFRLLARFDWKTAYFSGMPGGIIEMVSMGASNGADVRRIAIVHSARILLVVLAVPFIIRLLGAEPGLPQASTAAPTPFDWTSWAWLLFSCLVGYYAGRLLRLPIPELLGPMTVSAALHLTGVTQFVTPAAMVVIAQLAIGSMIGCRFSGLQPRETLVLVIQSAGSVVILLGTTVGLAALLAAASGVSISHLVLAYSPGGLAEMGLVALSLQVDVSLVIVLHTARILLVAVGAGAVFRLLKETTKSARPNEGDA